MNNELILTKKEFKKIMEVIKYTSKEECRPILKDCPKGTKLYCTIYGRQCNY